MTEMEADELQPGDRISHSRWYDFTCPAGCLDPIYRIRSVVVALRIIFAHCGSCGRDVSFGELPSISSLEIDPRMGDGLW